MWEMIRTGGWMMVPLALCSLVGLAVLIERVFVLRRHRIVVPQIAETVETLSAGTDYGVAYAVLDRHPGPFASIVRAGLDHADDAWEITRDVLQEEGRQQATRLMWRLGVLETVASVAPLLGLLGTVLGMIKVFAGISEEGLGNPEALSGGIGEAMITTAVGLSIGIPALVAHNWLSGRAEQIVFELEVYASKVLDTLRARQTREPGYAAGVRAGASGAPAASREG
jgi:biopolymer transport protein ExbB